MLTPARLIRRHQRLRSARDRGSAAAAMVMFIPLFLLLAAFVIDVGGMISQRQRAEGLADQAARYAAQDIDMATLRSTGTAVVDTAACPARVQQFMVANGLPAEDATCIAPQDGAAVTVQVTLDYQPIMLGTSFGLSNTVKATGNASALTAAQ
jgi:Flp pilus assembly protein TadG